MQFLLSINWMITNTKYLMKRTNLFKGVMTTSSLVMFLAVILLTPTQDVTAQKASDLDQTAVENVQSAFYDYMVSLRNDLNSHPGSFDQETAYALLEYVNTVFADFQRNDVELQESFKVNLSLLSGTDADGSTGLSDNLFYDSIRNVPGLTQDEIDNLYPEYQFVLLAKNDFRDLLDNVDVSSGNLRTLNNLLNHLRNSL